MATLKMDVVISSEWHHYSYGIESTMWWKWEGKCGTVKISPVWVQKSPQSSRAAARRWAKKAGVEIGTISIAGE